MPPEWYDPPPPAPRMQTTYIEIGEGRVTVDESIGGCWISLAIGLRTVRNFDATKRLAISTLLPKLEAMVKEMRRIVAEESPEVVAETEEGEVMDKSKTLCEGCRDDYYNKNREGGCWTFANAKVVQLQRVGTWQPPPYSWHPETRLSCYNPDGCAMLTKDDPRIKTPKEIQAMRAAKTEEARHEH